MSMEVETMHDLCVQKTMLYSIPRGKHKFGRTRYTYRYGRFGVRYIPVRTHVQCVVLVVAVCCYFCFLYDDPYGYVNVRTSCIRFKTLHWYEIVYCWDLSPINCTTPYGTCVERTYSVLSDESHVPKFEGNAAAAEAFSHYCREEME